MDLSAPLLLVPAIVLVVGLAFLAGLAGVRAFERFREVRARAAENLDIPSPSVEDAQLEAACPQIAAPSADPADQVDPTIDPERRGLPDSGDHQGAHFVFETGIEDTENTNAGERKAEPFRESVDFDRVTEPVIAVRIVPDFEKVPAAGPDVVPVAEHNIHVSAETAPTYLGYFGLHEDPFAVTPDLHYWVATRIHRDALTKLFHAVRSGKGCMALTGPAGTGKTFVLEHLAAKLKDSGIDFAFIVNPRLTVDDFYEAVALDLGLECESGKVRRLMAIQERVIQASRVGSTVALVVDNAHMLDPAVLDEIDLLGNVESRRAKLIQIVLSGQPELIDKIDEAAGLSSLRQRIASHVRLRSLEHDEAIQYLREHLEKAGDPDLFPLAAMQAIIEAAEGVPRQMNLLASATLECACGMRERELTAQLVEAAARQLGYDNGVRPERHGKG